jgi:methionine--tRNA ligase beta chain
VSTYINFFQSEIFSAESVCLRFLMASERTASSGGDGGADGDRSGGLRAAKVLAAERIPKSSKLLKLTVEIDGEKTVVAGMGKDYTPEEIVGKTIVVANLKPAKLMGVESRGMLLATDTEEGLTLLGFDRLPKTGEKIH